MNKLYAMLLLLSFITLLPACKSSKKSDPSPQTGPEAIVRTWKVKRVTLNGTENKSTDYSTWRLEFRTRGTYVFTDASGSRTGTWELTNENKILITNKGQANEQKPVVLELTKDSLELEYTFTNYKNGAVKEVYEYIPA